MRITINARDIVTLCILVACVWLLSHGIDTVVAYSLLGVVCGYYGIELVPPKIVKWRKNHKKKGGKNERAL